MRRKRGSKSKDRDKSKTEEVKSHKHSRRKRKSSDSESESESSEVTAEQTEESKSRNASSKKPEDPENNASGTRTRHSRRLAAITASSDEVTEEVSEIIMSPAKTGKSSPYSSSSPSKDPKKKESGTPDRHRVKDINLWKVKSTNGAGSGELQKLKICRQRSPENIPLPDDPQSNNVGESLNQDEELGEVPEVVASEQIEKPANNLEENSIEYVTNEPNLADIELPPATESVGETKATPGGSTNEVEKPVEDVTAAAVVQVEVQSSESVEKFSDSVNVEKTEAKPIAEKEEQPEQPALVNDIDSVEIVADVGEIRLPSESVNPESEKNETKVVVEESHSPAVMSVEAPVAKASEIPEQEEASLAEIVLTVDENAIEEPGSATVAPEGNGETVEKKENEIPAVAGEVILPTIKPVDIEEVYDYENDDTKEEGELSPNESMSPIHEVFKKYPASLRKRFWGSCGISHFNRCNIFVDENTLKEYHIKKRAISKEEFDASDSEDLIFVKEIREENIVHEIESETNNTSFYDKDDDDVVPSSPKRKNNSLEIKKLSLESDKISDKSSRRIVKDKSLNHEGKSVLYITNLVRPFTVNQLRELLLRTGRIVEDGFWIDSIKSKCYVQFVTEDEAFETRHALHGIRWPVNNPKVLNVQFATQDDLLSAQAQTHESEIPRKTEPLVVSNHAVEPSQKRIDWKKHFEQYDDRPNKKIKDVREWDIGKPAHPDEMMFAEADDLKRKEEQESLRRNRKDKRRRNEISDEEISVKKPRKQVAENQPAPEAKLLDDLFRRTKAAPSIYWLPLSEEQIATKQETRRKHLEDIDRQLKKHPNDHQDSRRRGDRDRERRRSRR